MHNPLESRLGKFGVLVATLAYLVKGVIWIIEKVQDAQFVAQNKGAIVGILSAWWLPLILTIVGLGIIAYAARKPQVAGKASKGREFHTSRTEMVDKTGGLSTELDGAGSAWAAFETGSHYATLHDDHKRRIKRLILSHPDSEFIRDWTSFDQSTDRAVATIREATRRALALGTQVRWRKTHLLNCVIGEPDSLGAWARVQTQLPYIQAARWPGYKVYRKTDAELYDNIRNSFESIWERSEEPTL